MWMLGIGLAVAGAALLSLGSLTVEAAGGQKRKGADKSGNVMMGDIVGALRSHDASGRSKVKAKGAGKKANRVIQTPFQMQID